MSEKLEHRLKIENEILKVIENFIFENVTYDDFVYDLNLNENIKFYLDSIDILLLIDYLETLYKINIQYDSKKFYSFQTLINEIYNELI